ncbi:hypothetical protein PanWU01x14_121920, partial [Parasponia andersonii]
AKLSWGCIKQVKSHLKNPPKDSQSVTEFSQTIKARADELALLGAFMDKDYLIEKILNGLGSNYKELISVVQVRDTHIIFDELHQKLLNFEVHLLEKKPKQLYFPAFANPTQRANTG